MDKPKNIIVEFEKSIHWLFVSNIKIRFTSFEFNSIYWNNLNNKKKLKPLEITFLIRIRVTFPLKKWFDDIKIQSCYLIYLEVKFDFYFFYFYVFLVFFVKF
jgi:hypothetical protein